VADTKYELNRVYGYAKPMNFLSQEDRTTLILSKFDVLKLRSQSGLHSIIGLEIDCGRYVKRLLRIIAVLQGFSKADLVS